MSKIKFFSLVLIILISHTVACETILRTIYLQKNEQHFENLDDLYKFSAKEFSFQDTCPQVELIPPYQQLIVAQSSVMIESIASFQFNECTKYQIGFIPDSAKDKKQITFVYYLLQVESTQGNLERKEIQRYTIEINITDTFSIYGSMYDHQNGFVSIEDVKNNQIYTFRFSYEVNNGFIFEKQQRIKLKYHISVKATKGFVYISNFNVNQVNLFKYDTTSKFIDEVFNRQIADYKEYIPLAFEDLLLLFHQASKSVIYYKIDFYHEKLRQDSLIIPIIDDLPLLKVYASRYQDILIISEVYQSKSLLIEMRFDKYINEGQLQIISSHTIPFYFPTQPVFISEKTAVYKNDDKILMVNWKSSHLIFDLDVQLASLLDPQQFIGNQVILQNQINNKESPEEVSFQIQYLQFNHPQIKLNGQDCTINLTINSKQFSQVIQLITKITSTPITQFKQKEIHLQNVYSVIQNLSQQTIQYFFKQQIIGLSQKPIRSFEQYMREGYQTARQYPFNRSNFYYIPVEDYIEGNNLNFEISLSSKSSFMKDISFSKMRQLFINQNFDAEKVVKYYHVDGFFSTIIIEKINNMYYISAAVPQLIDKGNNQIEIRIHKCGTPFQSEIHQMDNYGSFIQFSDQMRKQKRIFLPFANRENLSYGFFEKECDQTNFNFASDPLNNVLFVICGDQLQQINYSYSGQYAHVIIVNQRLIELRINEINSLVCIKGQLFLQNSSLITAYNYILNGFIGSTIAIPKISETHQQKIYLFSSSFVIIVEDNPISIITQYAYGFKESRAQFLRNIYLDNHQISSQPNIIVSRNEIEYLFIQTNTSKDYLIYRMNSNVYSQNQFYGLQRIKSDLKSIPLISSHVICQLSHLVSCNQILEYPSIVYTLEIRESLPFSDNLTTTEQITLKIGDQKQVYTIYLSRDASENKGVMNINSKEFKHFTMKCELETISNGDKYSLNGFGIYKGCTSGWESSIWNEKIVGNLEFLFDRNNLRVLQLLYENYVEINNNGFIINSNITKVEGQFMNCKILDDKGSFKLLSNQQTDSVIQMQMRNLNQIETKFQMNLYSVCSTNFTQFEFEFLQDKQGRIIFAQLNSNKTYQFQKNQSLTQLERIMTFENELYMYLSSSQLLKIKKNELSYDTFQILQPDFISQNIIINQGIELLFFKNGVIGYRQSNKINSIYEQLFLKDLLQQFKIFIDATDIVERVYQLLDNVFFLSCKNSYIFEIQFDWNKNKLIASTVNQYYYREAFKFTSLVSKGEDFTFIFGENYQNKKIVAVYQDKHRLDGNTFLYEQILKLNTNQQVINVRFIPQQMLTLYLENGDQQVYIPHSEISIQFDEFQKVNSDELSIQPINQINQKITFKLNTYKKQASFIYRLNINLTQLAVILIITFI